jgi:hypothetical protein
MSNWIKQGYIKQVNTDYIIDITYEKGITKMNGLPVSLGQFILPAAAQAALPVVSQQPSPVTVQPAPIQQPTPVTSPASRFVSPQAPTPQPAPPVVSQPPGPPVQLPVS